MDPKITIIWSLALVAAPMFFAFTCISICTAVPRKQAPVALQTAAFVLSIVTLVGYVAWAVTPPIGALYAGYVDTLVDIAAALLWVFLRITEGGRR